MPYIPPHRRGLKPANVGELTYQLTKCCTNFLDGARAFNKFGEILAALEATKLEFYRRAVAPYEDGKCAENGDVF